MSNRLPQVFAMAIGAALFLLSPPASQGINAQNNDQANTAPAACSPAEKKQIIQKIENRIKNDPKLKDQFKTLNIDVHVMNPKRPAPQPELVWLEGRIKPPATRADVENHAKAVLKDFTCVKRVLNKVGTGPIGGCGTGFQQCPGTKICVSDGSSCRTEGSTDTTPTATDTTPKKKSF